VPPRNISPSSYVGPQVAHFRDRRGWTQRDLANRLRELGIERTGWDQTKIHKLERGKLKRVLVDDVFELALALDVSPLYLMTPLESHDEKGNAYKVWLGGRISRWPRDVRSWIRGVRPLLHRGEYLDDEAAGSGRRFYLVESQPLFEWHRIAESGNYAKRVAGMLTELVRDEDEEDEGG
jgi:transcriptional regulator with XRE-family HTH domain